MKGIGLMADHDEDVAARVNRCPWPGPDRDPLDVDATSKRFVQRRDWVASANSVGVGALLVSDRYAYFVGILGLLPDNPSGSPAICAAYGVAAAALSGDTGANAERFITLMSTTP